MNDFERIFSAEEIEELSEATVATKFDAATQLEPAAIYEIRTAIESSAIKAGLGRPVLPFTYEEVREAVVKANTLQAENELDETLTLFELTHGFTKKWPKEPVGIFALSYTLYGRKYAPDLVAIPGKLITIGFSKGLINWDQKLNEQDEGQPEVSTGYIEPYALVQYVHPLTAEHGVVGSDQLLEIPLSRIFGMYLQCKATA
jgi:hypothetical protein